MTPTLQELGLPSTLPVWQITFLTLLSYGVGILGGFVGLALGTMRLPALLLLGMPAPIAAGTNILVSTLSAITGAYRHLREGRVDMSVVAIMGIPSLIGAFIGGFASGRVPESLLISLAGILVTWQGIELVVRGRREPGRVTPGHHASAGTADRAGFPGRVWAEAGIGLGVGLLGGAVGLILGTIRLPALIRIVKLDPRVAAGSNLFIGFIMGGFGWIGHAIQGNVDYPLLVLMALSGMLGTYSGAKLTGRVSRATLVRSMGIVLLVVGTLMLWEAYRRALPT